jgi:hypothetical protein
MKKVRAIARRDLIKATATIAAAVPAITATSVVAQQSQPAQQPFADTAAQPTTLAEVPLGPATRLHAAGLPGRISFDPWSAGISCSRARGFPACRGPFHEAGSRFMVPIL